MKRYELRNARRFNTIQDYEDFMAGDKSKCIPERIIQGDKSVPNPDYVNAMYELSMWIDTKYTKSERKI